MGHQATLLAVQSMSAVLPTTDIAANSREVRFGPTPDSCSAAKNNLFDCLVGKSMEFRWDSEPECVGGFATDSLD